MGLVGREAGSCLLLNYLPGLEVQKPPSLRTFLKKKKVTGNANYFVKGSDGLSQVMSSSQQSVHALVGSLLRAWLLYWITSF